MVFPKRGSFKGKQQTPARTKGKNAGSFIDQDDDFSNEQLLKTPGGKTPKGKQFQSDKRVSFQIPGKNTPNKTPRNENSVGKKQLTPGKPAALKEFKGLNSKSSKQQADEDDDDDDDEDDDVDFDMLGVDDDEEDDDSDDDEDDDDDEEEEGGNKIMKGQGSQQKQMNNTEKTDNVGKNKTPSKNSVKSQEKKTPQASLKSETKNKALAAKKPVSEDDDDEEDDDDDDDEDVDMDMLLGGEEDDDDDDDEEEDDDDDEDDDDEEEKTPQQKKQNLINSSQKKPQIVENKTPSKHEKTPNKQVLKNEKSPQATAKVTSLQKMKKNENPIGYQKALEITEERKRDRDIRTLYVGNLPKDITPTELKALSNDIINVNIPLINSKKKRKHIFAFLEFNSEAKAEENHKLLKSKTLRGQPIAIDYTGVKRGNNPPKTESAKINLKKLFVSSIPLDTTIDKIAAIFPKSNQIYLNICPTYRNATVNFTTEEDAAAALEASKNAKLDGKPIIVLYSTAINATKKRKRPNKGKKQAAKKMKMEVKKESSDDDDDDDDNEDDDEEE